MSKEESKTATKKKWLIGGAIAVAIYSISLFVPYVSQISWYPIYFAKCGGQPISATRFAAAYTYTRPGDNLHNIFADEYFCSEQEARDAGFRKYP